VFTVPLTCNEPTQLIRIIFSRSGYRLKVLDRQFAQFTRLDQIYSGKLTNIAFIICRIVQKGRHMFGIVWRFRARRISNGAIFDSNKFKMATAAILDNLEWPYLRNGSRSTYIARIARIAQLSCFHSAFAPSFIWCTGVDVPVLNIYSVQTDVRGRTQHCSISATAKN